MLWPRVSASQSPMSPLTIVFDLDGTLIDTAPDLVATLNVVFVREGLSEIPFDEGRTMIGGGGRRMIERGLQADGRALVRADVDRMFADFIAYYSDHIADASRPFPGLELALDELERGGAQFAVCTNKLEGLSIKLLEALGLKRRFVTICGQDTFGVQKPNPEMLRRTIERAGGNADRSIMVGDSANDVDAALAAGIPVVAVDFGYTEVPAARLGADRVISHFRALPAAISQIFGRSHSKMG